MIRRIAALSFFLIASAASAPAQQRKDAVPRYVQIGEARQSTLRLGSGFIRGAWSVAGGKFRPVSMQDGITGKAIVAAKEAFSLTLADGRIVHASELKVVGLPRFERLRLSQQGPAIFISSLGTKGQLRVELEEPATGLRITWRAFVWYRGGNYLRQEIKLRPATELLVKEIVLVDLDLTDAQITGKVPGSPVTAENHFLGVEHPMSECRVQKRRVTCGLRQDTAIKAGREFVLSSVIGVAHAGQMRRDFLTYLETERAHPYRTFLHYNTWYDIGYFSKFDEAASVAAIELFGRELVEKRGVEMDSFLFDDGWDDPKTLWKFHSGFPKGFAPLKAAAAKYGAAPGVWLSPWGGYGKPRQERLRYGATQGFETNKDGFALSGPVYFKRFHDTCLEMIRKYGVNQFKFDGIGRARGSVPGSEFGSDFEAAIQLIRELRAEKPDIYINLTTGTWPSPFWLLYADSIWRGGEDHEFAGVGHDRQRWITYRDSQTYKNIVQGGPLFPLNSLMLHGLIYAKKAKQLDADPHNDFTAEVRSYFGTGTQLQEMYVTPALLTQENWDALAEAAAWSRRNADVLADTHWVGGDPAKLELYGWAAWSPRLGILTLRNPSEKPQKFELDAQKIFELPPGAPRRYAIRSPWREDQNRPPLEIEAGKPVSIALEPFAVLTFEATPAKPLKSKR